MNRTAQIHIVLNTLAFVGMLVFASQAAQAASSSPDLSTTSTPTVQDASSVPDDSAVDNLATPEVEDPGDIGEIGNQDFETPEIADVELPEVETPESE